MKEKSVTYEQVAEICEEMLIERGRAPIRDVRIKVCGNNNEVTEYVRQWNDRKAAASRVEAEISPALTTAIRYEISERIQKAKASLTKELKEAMDQADDFKEDFNEAEKRIDTFVKLLDKAKEDLDKQTREYETDLAVCKERLSKAELDAKVVASERDLHMKNLELSRTEAARLQLQLEGIHEGAQKGEDRITLLSRQSEELRQAKDKAECSNAAAETSVAGLRQELEHLKELLEEVKNENKELNAKYEDARNGREDAEKRASVLEVKLEMQITGSQLKEELIKAQRRADEVVTG